MGVFAVIEMGAETSGARGKRFGVGPGARTSLSSFFEASLLATEGKAGY